MLVMVRIPAARDTNDNTRKTPERIFKPICFSGGFSMEFFFPFFNIERIKRMPNKAIITIRE